MTLRHLKLNELEIRRYRGIRKPSQRMFYPPGTFSPGLNLLYGANGSGKSTTAGAIKALLWPQVADSAGAGIVGVWECEGQETTLALVGGNFSRSAATPVGETARLPGTPKPYSLSLQDLLLAEDEELAAAIRREMFGGLDLAGAAEKLGLANRPEGARAAARDLREAHRRLREVAAKQRELSTRVVELAAMEDDLEAARQAADRLRTLEELALLNNKRAAAESLKLEIERHVEKGVPQILTAEMRDSLAELHREKQDKQLEIELVRERLAAAQANLAGTGFAAGEPPASERIGELNDRLATVQNLESELGQRRRELAEAESLATTARNFVGGTMPDEGIADCTVEILARVRPFFIRYAECANRRDNLASALRLARDGVAEDERQRHAGQAVDCLVDWLAAGNAAEKHDKRWKIILPSVLAGVMATALLSVFASPWWLLAVLVGLVALAAFGYRAAHAAPTAAVASLRQACQIRYENLPSAPLVDDWRPQAVGRALREAEERQAEARLLAERMARAQSLEHDLREANRALAEAFQALSAAVADIGIEFDETPPAGWLEFAEAHARWHDAQARCQAARAAIERLQEARNDALEACMAIWRPYCDVRAADASDVRATVAGLAARVERWREATSQIREIEATIGRLRHDAEILGGKSAALIARVFPESGLSAERALDRMAVLLPDSEALRDCQARYDLTRREIREKEAIFQTLPGWTVEMTRWTSETIATRLAETKAVAATFEPLHERVIELRNEIERVGRGHDLTDALQARDTARAGIVSLARKAALAGVGAALLDFLRETAGGATSAVLKRARSLFAEISGYRYDLVVEGTKTVKFFARDCLTDERKDLAELSSATHIQLLLAVRVAFLECREEGASSPPLILDEVLANSDDERARAAMQAIVHVVRRGRQVFYLTARKDELDKWRSLIETVDADLPCRVIALPLASSPPAPAAAIRSLVAGPVVPRPENGDYDAYGKALEVPPFSLFDGDDGAIHMFYLLLDAERLYRLLQIRCRTWGQFKTIRHHGGKDVFAKLGVAADPAFPASVEARAALLTKLRELYAVGRGLPVSQDVILQEDSPVRNLKFADQVARLTEAVDHDAKRLLEALENRAIKGFLQRKIDELGDWLGERGYLDRRPVLPTEQLVPRTMAEAANALTRGGVAIEEARCILDRALTRSADGAPAARKPIPDDPPSPKATAKPAKAADDSSPRHP